MAIFWFISSDTGTRTGVPVADSIAFASLARRAEKKTGDATSTVLHWYKHSTLVAGGMMALMKKNTEYL